jgi:hypothetical protein
MGKSAQGRILMGKEDCHPCKRRSGKESFVESCSKCTEVGSSTKIV